MRTLGEIIEDVKSDVKVTREEMIYSLLCMANLHYADHMAIRMMRDKTPANLRLVMFGPDFQVRESFDRFKKALNSDPKKFLGPDNDPKNKEYQEIRKKNKEYLAKKMKEQHGQG